MPSPDRDAATDVLGSALSGVFEGVRVVELGQYVAAPIAAELLAHGGADVVKIEPVGGDVTRYTDPLPNQDGSPGADGRQYVVKARGKRALPVDLATPEGRAVAERLALDCDVVITNMRPGNAQRLGLDDDSLRPRNPRLIYGEINGFGDTGPNAGRPSFDLIAQAWSGLRFATAMDDDGELVRYEPYLCDYTAGLLLAFGIAGALHHRERTGLGQRVSTSLAHAGLYLQHRSANLFESTDGWKHDLVDERVAGRPLGQLHASRGAMVSPEVFFMTTYTTCDGAVSIGAGPRLGGVLCERFDTTDPRVSPDWSDRSVRGELLEATRLHIAEVIAAMTTDQVIEILHEIGVPVSPVRMLEEVLVDPAAHAAGLVYDTEHPRLGRYTMASAPLAMSASDYRARDIIAAYGEHSVEVLTELGYDVAAIADLVASGAVYSTTEYEAS